MKTEDCLGPVQLRDDEDDENKSSQNKEAIEASNNNPGHLQFLVRVGLGIADFKSQALIIGCIASAVIQAEHKHTIKH